MPDTSSESSDVLDDVAAVNASIPLHDLLGLEFDDGPDGSTHAEVRMPVRPEAFGFSGNLHGGAIATLIDVSCALAAARHVGFHPDKESLVTADMHVRYLGRPRTDIVVASADVVRAGSQMIVVECKITDNDDHLVAVADFSIMRVAVRRPLLDDLAQS